MNNSEKKTDLRIQKTLSALTGALKELMCEKDIESITVKEICDKAQTRKATFYNHFTDKNDLLAYTIRSQMQLSEEEGSVYDDPDDPAQYYIQILLYLMEFLQKNEKMMSRIIKGPDTVVGEIYKEEMEPVFYERLKKEQKNGNEAVKLPGMLSGVMSEVIIQSAWYWFMHTDSISRQEAADQIKVLTDALFKA